MKVCAFLCVSQCVLSVLGLSFFFFFSLSLLQNCRLNDDTVLDNISFAEPSQAELPDLRAEEQAVILGVW